MLLLHGDCLELLKEIPDHTVDLILTDPPYGTTSCKWDTVIPFDKMWEQLNRVIKPHAAILLFGSQPFTTELNHSNIKNYKYDWIWDKVSVSNPQLAKIQPLKNFEIISVFGGGSGRVNYYPQGLKKIETPINKGAKNTKTELLNHIKRREDYHQEFTNYPKMMALRFPRPAQMVHPTEKPIDLLEYLILTYTKRGEIVLDFTMGSGSTGIACVNTHRDFIGIELDDEYFKLAGERIKKAQKEKQYSLFPEL